MSETDEWLHDDYVFERDRREKAEARAQELEEALRFYADEENWQEIPMQGYRKRAPAHAERGTRARAALERGAV